MEKLRAKDIQMATHSAQGEKDLQWCLERALLEFDSSGPDMAVASIFSDFQKCESTQSISPMLIMVIVAPAAKEGRQQFIDAVMGFNV